MKTRIGVWSAAVLLMAMMATSPAGVAQFTSQVPSHPQTPGIGDPPTSHLPQDTTTEDPMKARQDAGQVRMQNEDRHKKLLADTDKLLQLATELKAEVAKSNKDELSVSVVRKAAEIEKLAHDVKSRMTN